MPVAKVAVSAATYWLDRLYDYNIPENLCSAIKIGVRVLIPFGKGSRNCEGIVLGIEKSSTYPKLKNIYSVVDPEPVLENELLSLAVWMHNRYFCTVYEAAKTMLPSGMWVGNDGTTRSQDLLQEYVALDIDAEDANQLIPELRKRARMQAELLSVLLETGDLPVSELLHFTGASKASLKGLESKGIVFFYKKHVLRKQHIDTKKCRTIPMMTSEQQAVFKNLQKEACNGGRISLLHGITGSGKTIIYLHLIQWILEQGKGSIILVPEIALTQPMLKEFTSYFGKQVAILHSRLSTGERYDEWKRIKSGKAKVVLGTRSAVFAPVQNLGLLIIDEEQEESYISQNSPRYNAIEIAQYRSKKNGALLLLGTATPNITSMYYAQEGHFSYYRLKKRYNQKELPEVRIVDMKEELKKGNGSDLSTLLCHEIDKNLQKGEQSILFLNRRGTNKLVTCESCGFVYSCPRCSVALTYHGNIHRLICHRCGYSQPICETCPECGGILHYIGTGTQKVVQEIHERFPHVEVLRMDTDTVRKAGSHEAILDRFVEEKVPILVGTQMVTKGFNFGNVTLVGVLSADQSLFSGDYRAGERTFSLITQVIGRSGRGNLEGRAIVQTYHPDNEIIKLSAEQNYLEFYKMEIALRKIQNAPPFTHFLSITVSGEKERQVISCVNYVKKYLEYHLEGVTSVQILGPVPLFVVKVNNRYRYRVNISCSIMQSQNVRARIAEVILKCYSLKEFRNLSIYGENNPLE
jgi:primosomal protein N' (replication factor Y)